MGGGGSSAPPGEEDRAQPSGARGARWWLPVALGALPFGVLTIAGIARSGQPSTTFGDTAVIELRTLAASRFRELLGPYSRFGWQHPGPAFFYWAAPFFRLSGSRPGGLGAAAAAVNLLWVVLIVAAVRRAAGEVAAWVAAAVAVAFGWRFGMSWFHNPWNPFLVVLSTAACGVLSAAVAARVRWALPLLAGAASFTVQSHVGTLPAVGVMALVTLGPTAWLERAEWRRWRMSLLASGVVSLLLWLPPLAEEIAHRPGNLTALFRFFRDHHTGHHPPGDVARIVAPQLTMTNSRLGWAVSGDLDRLAHVSVAGVVLFSIVIGLLLAATVRGVRTRRPMEWGLCAAGLAGSLAALNATRSAAGELAPYFTTFSSGVGLVASLGLALTAADMVSPRARRWRTHAGLVRAGAALVAVVVVAVSVSAGRVKAFAAEADRPSVGVLADLAEHALAGRPHRRVLLRLDDDETWIDGLGMMAELERRGTRVSVGPDTTFLTGVTYRSRGDEDATLVLTHPDPGDPPPADATRLGMNVDGIQIWYIPRRAPARSSADHGGRGG